MKYLFYFISFIFPTLCSSAQPAERDSSIYIASSQLYRMGESLVVSMQVDITRQIPSNESVILVPQLSDSLDNFIQLPAIYVNGRKQHIFFQRETGRQKKDYEELRRRNDRKQSVHYLRSIPFTHWMKHASLHLIEKECGCGVPRHTDSTYLTRLNMLPDIHPHVAFITPQMEERKLREESGRAYLDFPLNETIIYPEYRNNPAELAKIKRSIDLIKNDTNVVISHIDIHGYASPEGPYSNNERLARERTQTLKDYVCSQYSFNDTLFTTHYTPEDWDGFIKLLTDTVISHREELLHIAESKNSPDEKERKIRKRYPEEFRFILQHWFPGLRHSDYTIHYVVRPFTVEQAKQVFESNPKNLSIEEMFRFLAPRKGQDPHEFGNSRFQRHTARLQNLAACVQPPADGVLVERAPLPLHLCREHCRLSEREKVRKPLQKGALLVVGKPARAEGLDDKSVTMCVQIVENIGTKSGDHLQNKHVFVERMGKRRTT